MASLTKRKTSVFWVACFTDRNGRRLKRSTATINRKQAQKLADEYEQAATNKRTARQVRNVITALHKEITGEDLKEATVKEFTTSWIARKKPEVADSTLNFYKKTVEKFLKFLGEKADAELSQITTNDVVGFRNFEATTLSPKTVNHDLKCLKMLFRSARQDKVITEDPTEFIKIAKKTVAAVRRRPFTIPELKAVLAVAAEEWRSMILFALYTGQRLGDIASLTWANVDLLRDVINLTHGKREKSSSCPLQSHCEGIWRPSMLTMTLCHLFTPTHSPSSPNKGAPAACLINSPISWHRPDSRKKPATTALQMMVKAGAGDAS